MGPAWASGLIQLRSPPREPSGAARPVIPRAPSEAFLMPNATKARPSAGNTRWLCAFTFLISLAFIGVPLALRAEEPAALKGHEWPLRSAVFSPDGKLLATGDAR